MSKVSIKQKIKGRYKSVRKNPTNVKIGLIPIKKT
jgi:hypothetical protein